ncbi:putative ATPase domain protein [Klebsiella pneumoniae VA360]|nr:putative ATPase domain protein [Klebsiella pneumoniae VA360]
MVPDSESNQGHGDFQSLSFDDKLMNVICKAKLQQVTLCKLYQSFQLKAVRVNLLTRLTFLDFWPTLA